MNKQDESLLINELTTIINRIIESSITDKNGVYWIRSKSKIDHSLYSGNAGVIYFLFEFYKYKPNEMLKYYILNSCKRIARDLKFKEHYSSFDFYTGSTGTLYIVLMVSNYFKIQLDIGDIDQIISKIKFKQEIIDLGLVGGVTGSIYGLLKLNEIYESSFLQRKIIELINILFSNLSYKYNEIYINCTFYSYRPLCGISHGNSGVAFLFLEIGEKLKNRFLIDFAVKLFNYEDKFYNIENRNWPDFRINKSQNYDDKFMLNQNDKIDLKPFSYVFAWCHGAIGISLARIKYMSITRSNKYLKKIENTVFDLLQNEIEISCQCHGSVGNNQIILEMFFLYKVKNYFELFQKLCLKNIKSKKNRGFYITGDPNSFDDLSLMNGLGGIGLSYLHALNPTKNTPLMPRIDHKIDYIKLLRDINFQELIFTTVLRNHFNFSRYLLSKQELEKLMSCNSINSFFIYLENGIENEWIKRLIKLEFEVVRLNNSIHDFNYFRNKFKLQRKSNLHKLHLAGNIKIQMEFDIEKISYGNKPSYFVIHKDTSQYKLSKISLKQFQFISEFEVKKTHLKNINKETSKIIKNLVLAGIISEIQLAEN